MDERDFLADQFEENRPHLRGVAYRMLGSMSEADDAVQEAWLRISRADTSDVENLGGWLTTIVARVCLDHLRSRKSRREEPFDAYMPEPVAAEANPEHETVMADSVGLALLVVLETLTPSERLAFVLHDMFDVPFDEIAPIVGRTPTATRQLASRARRRVQGATTTSDVELFRRREIIDAFLAASRSGNFEALLAVLDPDVVLRVDESALQMGVRSGWITEPEVRGANVVAKQFAGRAQAAQLAMIDGVLGVVWANRGKPIVVFGFTIQNDKLVKIELLADPSRLGQLNVQFIDG